MSNINPNPRFIATPGTPTACHRWPAQTRTMAEVEADEERKRAVARDKYGRELKSWRGYTPPVPGRYALSGAKQFTALCGHAGCEHTLTASWGESASGRVGYILRQNGWDSSGRTRRAIWFCPNHLPDAQQSRFVIEVGG